MRHVAANRRDEIARFQRLLERVHWPRFSMMLIVTLTAAVGFLASFAFLQAGVDALWLRYLIAVVIAYLGFLFFLWCWLRLRRHAVLDGLDIPMSGSRGGSSGSLEKTWEPGGGRFGGGGASGSFDDGTRLDQVSSESGSISSAGGSELSEAAGGFDLEDLAFVLLAIAAVLAAAWVAVWIVWTAPTLLAELFLDAALAAGLYKRLRDVQGAHWLRTALRRTALPFIAVALSFSLAGAAMQFYAPDATSLGQVLQHFKGSR